MPDPIRDLLLNILPSIKADLRLKIIEQLKKSGNLKFTRGSELQALALNSIVVDFLDAADLPYTKSVFIAETGDLNALDRPGVCKALGLSLADLNDSILERIVGLCSATPGGKSLAKEIEAREAKLLKAEESLNETRSFFENWKANELAQIANERKKLRHQEAMVQGVIYNDILDDGDSMLRSSQ